MKFEDLRRSVYLLKDIEAMATPANKPTTAPAARPATTAPTAKTVAKPAAATTTRPLATTAPKVTQTEAGAGKNAPAVVQQAQLPATSEPADLPAHIKRNLARGSENVEQSDLVIPRIELAQALSRCIDEKNEGHYIEGAKAGMFYNSVTRQLYGPNLFFIPVFYMKQYLGWKDRKKGGGFCGAHDDLAAAQAAIDAQDEPEVWEATETGQQLVLIVDPENDYATEEAILSCARTKFKVSRQLNSLIRIHGYDRFSRYYELFSVDEQNSNNENYKNIGFRLENWTPETPYKKAEALYEQVATGIRKVVVDDKYDDLGVGGEAGTDPAQPSEY